MSRSGGTAAWLLPALLLAGACTEPREDGPPPAAGAAERIVTLAPHLAELVHAAGAGERLVGFSVYSDFPQAVRSLPQVGDAFLVDLEQLALLEPDLVLAWASGTPERTVDELRQRGFRVEVLRTRRLRDVAGALRRIGRLTGQQDDADAAARRFLADLERLRARHAGGEPIRVFYQISARPLYTVNGEHYISELIELCRGGNVFADLDELAPLVSAEAVLARDPEVVLAGGAPGDEEPFAVWRRWDDLAAVRYGNFFTVDPALLGRATPRLLQSAGDVCRRLEQGRENRSQARPSAALLEARAPRLSAAAAVLRPLLRSF